MPCSLQTSRFFCWRTVFPRHGRQQSRLLIQVQANGVKDSFYTIGTFQFDPKNQTLSNRDSVRRITAKENEILKLLCLKKNQITKKEEILIALWGESDYFKGRSLDVFIAKLRKYFADDSSVKIENVHSVGFILSDVLPTS